MSHQDKKVKLDSKEEEEVEGGPAEAALAEEHEEHAGQVEEHAEQHEADDALEEGYKEELDGAVAALEEIQERIQGVKEEAIDKILAIEQAANRDCKPIFNERAQLISKIPSFWKFVLLQHWLLETLITDEDQEVLDYLEQVHVEENMDVKSGFVVRMHFAENPFFSNSVLEKKIDYLEDGTVKLSSVPPQWLPGKDLTQAKPPAGDEAEEDGQQATSFFQWFDVPAPEDEPATEDEIAEIMREHIWPNPLQLYMGETGHPPPEEELELGYGDEQDAMVEYVNDGYDQDLLDEEGFEGEEYPEVLEDDYGEYEEGPEGQVPEEVPAGEEAEPYEGGEGDYGDGDGYLDEKPTEDATLASGKTAAKEEAAGAQEEATPAAAAS